MKNAKIKSLLNRIEQENDKQKSSIRIHRYAMSDILFYSNYGNKKLEMTIRIHVDDFEKTKGDFSKRKIDGNLLLHQMRKYYEKKYSENDQNNTIDFIERTLILIDFTSMQERDYERLTMWDGKIHVINDNKNDVVVYRDFLKSASIDTKEKCVYFIDEKHFDAIQERTTLGYFKSYRTSANKLQLAKFYAATSLVLSSCDVLEGEEFSLKPEEVVIISDEERRPVANCITAISKSSIKEIIESSKKLLENISRKGKIKLDKDLSQLNYTINNLSQILRSEDIKTIKEQDNELFKIINEAYDILLGCMFDDIESVNETKDKITKFIDEDKKNNKNETNNKPEKWYKIRVNDYRIDSNFNDGEGLISEEFAKQINYALKEAKKSQNKRYKYSNSFQIRLPFIKGVVHSCKLKEFFKDHNIETIKGLTLNKSGGNDKEYIKEIDYDINKVKLVLTESQFKFLKPNILFEDKSHKYTNYQMFINKLNSFDYGFGIANVEPTHKKKNINLGYQFLATLPLKPEDECVEKLFKYNDKYIEDSTSRDSVCKYITSKNNENSFYLDIDRQAYNISKDIYVKTKRYRDRQSKKYTEVINELGKDCRLRCYGQSRFLSCDLLPLLYKAAGLDFRGNKEALKKHEFYADGISKNGKVISATILRSPHYSRNEIVILTNKCSSKEREKYFPHLEGTIMINPESLSAERLGGADYDGDRVAIITDLSLNEKIKENILIETKNGLVSKYPVVCIPKSSEEQVPFTTKSAVSCWKNGFDNRIGLVSNNAIKHSLAVYSDSLEEYYDDIAYYTILGGLTIDARKSGIKPDFSDNKKLPSDKFANLFISEKDLNKSIFPSVNKFNKKEEYIYQSLVYTTLNHYKNYYEENTISKIHKEDYIDNQTFIDKLTLMPTTSKVYKEQVFYAGLKWLLWEMFFDYIKDKFGNEQALDEVVDDYQEAFDEIYSLDINPNEMERKYLSLEVPFHYLTDYEQKIKTIDFVLSPNQVSQDTLDDLCDFTNGGYKRFFNIIKVMQQKIERGHLDSSEVALDGLNYLIKRYGPGRIQLLQDYSGNKKQSKFAESVIKESWNEIWSIINSDPINQCYLVGTDKYTSDDDVLHQFIKNVLNTIIKPSGIQYIQEISKDKNILNQDRCFDVFGDEFINGLNQYRKAGKI